MSYSDSYHSQDDEDDLQTRQTPSGTNDGDDTENQADTGSSDHSGKEDEGLGMYDVDAELSEGEGEDNISSDAELLPELQEILGKVAA